MVIPADGAAVCVQEHLHWFGLPWRGRGLAHTDRRESLHRTAMGIAAAGDDPTVQHLLAPATAWHQPNNCLYQSHYRIDVGVDRIALHDHFEAAAKGQSSWGSDYRHPRPLQPDAGLLKCVQSCIDAFPVALLHRAEYELEVETH